MGPAPKSNWLTVTEAIALLGGDAAAAERFVEAAQTGAIEVYGSELFSSRTYPIPRQDWFACTPFPTLHGRRVEGVNFAFWHARWNRMEARRADVEGLVRAGRRRGPEPGTTNAIGRERQALFPTLDAIGAGNPHAAVQRLSRARSGDLPGRGNEASRVRGLEKAYRKYLKARQQDGN